MNVLNDTLREMFFDARKMSNWDDDKAREYLRMHIRKFDAQYSQLYDEYLEEVLWRRRERISDRAAKCKYVSYYDESILDVSTEDGVVEVGFDKSDASRWFGKTRHRFIEALKKAKEFTEKSQVLAAIGEFARSWFKLYASVHSDVSVDICKRATLEQMNRINDSYKFDEENLIDALLGRGNFSPMDREQVECACCKLKMAKELAEIGKEAEAAAVAGIRYLTNDRLKIDVILVLRNLLATKQKFFDSCKSSVGRRVLAETLQVLQTLISELQTDELSSERYGEIMEMVCVRKWFAKPLNVRERIVFLLECFERKMRENDFEEVPSRGKPDVSKELGEIRKAIIGLEKMLANIERDWEKAKGIGMPDADVKYGALQEKLRAEIKNAKDILRRHEG